jgi:hypothetical protein
MSSDRLFRHIPKNELVFADDAIRSTFGPCPGVHDVAKVVSLATECELNSHGEASWNGRVHTFVLDLAFYNETFRGKLGFLDW